MEAIPGEVCTMLRFLSQDVADQVTLMMQKGSLDLSLRFERNKDDGELGWLAVGNRSYRCKVVELPTPSDAYAAVDSEVHVKAASVNKAIIVASQPDVVGGSSLATMEVEMLPKKYLHGLTPPTRNIRDHFAHLAASVAPSPEEIEQLLDEAAWLELTKEEADADVTFRSVAR